MIPILVLTLQVSHSYLLLAALHPQFVPPPPGHPHCRPVSVGWCCFRPFAIAFEVLDWKHWYWLVVVRLLPAGVVTALWTLSAELGELNRCAKQHECWSKPSAFKLPLALLVDGSASTEQRAMLQVRKHSTEYHECHEPAVLLEGE